MSQFLLSLAESGFIPDALIKIAVRFITNNRLKESSNHDNKNEIISALSGGVVAEKTYDEPNATDENAKVSLYLDSPYQISKITYQE